MRKYDHVLKSELIKEAEREINQSSEDDAIDKLIGKVSKGLYAIASGKVSSPTVISDFLKRRFQPVSDRYRNVIFVWRGLLPYIHDYPGGDV